MAIKLILSAKDKEIIFEALKEKVDLLEKTDPKSAATKDQVKRIEAIVFQIAFANDVA